MVNGQKLLVGVEAEVLVVVVGEIVGVAVVAHNKELHEAQQGVGVAVTWVVFVIHNLLHGPAWADLKGLELDLHHRNAIDQEQHVVTVKTVAGVDAQLVDDFKFVFAPVFDVDQGVLQGGAVFANKGVALAQVFGSSKHVCGDDLIAQATEFGVSQ